VQKRVLAQTQALCHRFPVYGSRESQRPAAAQSFALTS